jgi:hypothetical protein
MQPKIEQMVKDAIQPHLQPLLDKQVILEETVSQLQNNKGEKVLGCFSSCLSEGE